MEAFVYQLYIGLLLKFIPFRKIPGMFPNPEPGTQPPITIGTEPTTLLEAIKYATNVVCPFTPWKNKCLVKSLSARRMLSERGIQSQLSLGVSKDNNSRTIAHAWLKFDDFEVVEKDGDYLELHLF